MSGVDRKLSRRHLHSVRKCLHKIARRIRDTKTANPDSSDSEVNDTVVRMMSHKDLKVVSQDADVFVHLLNESCMKNADHFVGLVQSALLERAITTLDLACAHVEQT